GADRRQRLAQRGDAHVQLGDKGRQLLAEGHRGGVHQVGTTDLDQLRVATSLRLEAVAQFADGGQQLLVYLNHRRYMHGAGEGIVGTLWTVDVVIGLYRRLAPQGLAGQFVGTVGQYLVDVHVALGAAAGLPYREGKVFVETAGQHLIRCPGD